MHDRRRRIQFFFAISLAASGCMLFTDTSVNYVEPGPGDGSDTGGTTDTGGTSDTGGTQDGGGPVDTGPDPGPRIDCEAFCDDAEYLSTCIGEVPGQCGEVLCRAAAETCRLCVEVASCGGHEVCEDPCDFFFCELFPWDDDCSGGDACFALSECCSSLEGEEADECWEAYGEALSGNQSEFECEIAGGFYCFDPFP